MMTLRVQVMWSSQSLRMLSWNVTADALITGSVRGGAPRAPACAPEIVNAATAAAIAATSAIDRERCLFRPLIMSSPPFCVGSAAEPFTAAQLRRHHAMARRPPLLAPTTSPARTTKRALDHELP